MDEGVARVRALRERVRALLDNDRQRLQVEIRAYPTPIPRCDQQFNHLIERRDRLFAELARLDAFSASDATAMDDAERLLAFIDASACLGDEIKARLRAALSEGRFTAERNLSAADSVSRAGQEPNAG